MSSSAALFSFCVLSLPTSGSFLVSQLFTSRGQSIGASASASVLVGISGLISFRTDWFDLLAVQGTLKSLHQHHNLKASVLQPSVQSPSLKEKSWPRAQVPHKLAPWCTDPFAPASISMVADLVTLECFSYVPTSGLCICCSLCLECPSHWYPHRSPSLPSVLYSDITFLTPSLVTLFQL